MLALEKNMRIANASFLIILPGFLLYGCEPDQPASGVPGVVLEKNQTARVHEMDKLIAAVHVDLKALSQKHTWLSAYEDKCLREDGSIFFMPKLKEEHVAPQQPNQIYIGYLSIDMQKGFKYSNDIEEEQACRFPSLGSKVYAHLLIRGEKNAELRDKVKRLIIKRCRILHQKLKKENG